MAHGDHMRFIRLTHPAGVGIGTISFCASINRMVGMLSRESLGLYQRCLE